MKRYLALFDVTECLLNGNCHFKCGHHQLGRQLHAERTRLGIFLGAFTERACSDGNCFCLHFFMTSSLTKVPILHDSPSMAFIILAGGNSF